MQQQRSSCSKPTQESSTSREWQVIEAATAAAAVGNTIHGSSSSTTSTDTTNTTAAASLYKNADDEIISLVAELEKEKSTVVALRQQNQGGLEALHENYTLYWLFISAMTQNMTQLEITNKEYAVKLEEMEREKVRKERGDEKWHMKTETQRWSAIEQSGARYGFAFAKDEDYSWRCKEMVIWSKPLQGRIGGKQVDIGWCIWCSSVLVDIACQCTEWKGGLDDKDAWKGSHYWHIECKFSSWV